MRRSPSYPTREALRRLIMACGLVLAVTTCTLDPDDTYQFSDAADAADTLTPDVPDTSPDLVQDADVAVDPGPEEDQADGSEPVDAGQDGPESDEGPEVDQSEEG
ncbi:MAG: hypothetical protein JW797_06925 [Bradymonadales bacterium]|nr:hypothetical protein [Bradymonadales bacterium]